MREQPKATHLWGSKARFALARMQELAGQEVSVMVLKGKAGGELQALDDDRASGEGSLLSYASPLEVGQKRRKHYEVAVAAREGEILGALVWRDFLYDPGLSEEEQVNTQEFELCGMESVKPGSGVGSLLVAWACWRVRKKGREAFWVNTDPSALGFYKSLGFKFEGLEKWDWWGHLQEGELDDMASAFEMAQETFGLKVGRLTSMAGLRLGDEMEVEEPGID